MSHFTRVRTQFRDLDRMRTALVDLGYTVEEGAVRGYQGRQEKADIVVRTDTDFDIGFRREGESVIMVGDFWGLRINRSEFLQQVTQRYAYLTVSEQAAANGWQMTTEEVQEDGSIRLVMQRWA
ncbi:MAG: DUF1257 domain-containing protein [Chloroflexi bacterium]|nr:DUF1257 domain-containing protein [Chloroflexota bacterium]